MGILTFAQAAIALVLIAWGVIRVGSEFLAPVLGDADPGDAISIPRTLIGLGIAIAGAFILII